MNRIEQTGLLFKFEPTDYVVGASPLVTPIVNPTGNWIPFIPSEERQNKPFTFDTMSCSTFSALNIVETWINYFIANDKLTVGQLETISKLGFFDSNNKFNASDRFTAIMSGTTSRGNYMQSVWNSIKKDGLLPEKDLPFDPNIKTNAEYLNKSVISEEMKIKAKKILDILEFAYEFATLGYNSESDNIIKTALKSCPLHGAIPLEGTHAVEVIAKGKYFDSYDPYIKNLTKCRYSIKGIVNVKTPVKTYKYFSPREIVGLKPALVELLDKAREIAGIPFVINSGYRTSEHNAEIGGVESSAHITGEAVDIRAINATEHFLITKALFQVGFKRISRKYLNHIHCDIAVDKPQNVLF